MQGRPVLCQAGVSPRGLQFTARHSDTVIATANGLDGMKAVREQIRRHAASAGRDPDSIKVMFLVRPVIGETEEDAQHRAGMDAEDRRRQLEMSLSNLASNTMLDFAKFDLDEPLPGDVTTNGHSGMLVNMVRSGKTLRQIGEDSVGLPFVCTPASLAAQMDEAMQHIGGDGFLLTPPDATSMRSATASCPPYGRGGLCGRRMSSRRSARTCTRSECPGDGRDAARPSPMPTCGEDRVGVLTVGRSLRSPSSPQRRNTTLVQRRGRAGRAGGLSGSPG